MEGLLDSTIGSSEVADVQGDDTPIDTVVTAATGLISES